MISFHTNRTNIKAYVLKQFLGTLAIFALLFLYDSYVSTKPNSIMFYLVMGSLALIFLTIEIFRKRLFSVKFDNEKEQIHFLYKDFFSRESSKEISYKTARIDVDENTSILTLFRKSVTLYFLKNKMEICSVSKKDGFSYVQIEKMIQLIKTLSAKEHN